MEEEALVFSRDIAFFFISEVALVFSRDIAFFISDEASVFCRDIAFFISEVALVFSRDIAFFFSRTRLRSSLETSLFYLGSGFGVLSRRRFFFQAWGGLRLISEGAARELKYRNPGDKSFGIVFPDVTPQPLSCLTSAPSRPIRPPLPPIPPPTLLRDPSPQNFARNVFRRYLLVVSAPGPADGGKFEGQTVATRIRARCAPLLPPPLSKKFAIFGVMIFEKNVGF